MFSLDDIRIYLPKDISPESQENLFEALKQFPSNIDSRIYTIRLKDEPIVFQGDGLNGLLISHLPETNIKKGRVMVLSNTCDIASDKKTLLPNNIVYCPIVEFEKYIQQVKAINPNEDYIKSHIATIKKQRISNIFFLPQGGGLSQDSLVFFDKVISCRNHYLKSIKIPETRIFTLSDYGFYLFLFKLSIHFTRIREGIDRGTN
jgi:hypothetical protein